MCTTKYYKKIEEAQRETRGKQSSDFDINRLGRGGFVGKILANHLLYAFLRKFFPIARIGRLAIVTRYDDVKEVRSRHDAFEVPFGLEMTELAGANFVLGMQPGPNYNSQINYIRSAFDQTDIPKIIVPTAARIAKRLVDISGGKIDAIQDLLMRVPTEVCATYFGLELDDPQAFADWLMAISALLFADLFGNPITRTLALTGAKRVTAVIDRAIANARAGRVSSETLIHRLVKQPNGPSDKEIRAILMGLAVGFVPTNTMAAGHILEVLFSMPEAMAQATEAAAADKDDELERCLMEAMRFKPPIIPGLPRYVNQTVTIAKGEWREKTIPEGTTIIAATMSAMLDSGRIDRANDFDPERWKDQGWQKQDLGFGGEGLVHYCLGERIARAQLTQAFKPLLRQSKLRQARGRAGRLQNVGPFPRHMMVTFEPQVGHHKQSMITICVPISDAARVQAVMGEIAKLGNPAEPGIRNALNQTQRIHFANIIAIKGDSKKAEPSYVVVELNVDEPEGSAIDAMVKEAGHHLLPIFKLACDIKDPESLASCLRENAIQLKARPWDPSGLNFCGTPGLPVSQIEEQHQIAVKAHAFLGTWLEDHARFGTAAMSALRYVRNEFRRCGQESALVWPSGHGLAVARRKDLGTWEAVKSVFQDWPLTALTLLIFVAGLTLLSLYSAILSGWPSPLIIFASFIISIVHGVMFVALGAAIVAFLAGASVWWLRRKEKSDVSIDLDPLHSEVRKLAAVENPAGYVQNHLIAITPLKRGWFRRFTLAAAFWGIQTLVKYRFRPGFILDIGTIHFARWFRLPKTGKLVFFANYDGSWESYLEDFITKAHYGQTAVWSNAIGFPKTSFLIYEGAEDGSRFKRWVRRQQIPTRFWYSRFPQLTTDQMRNNALICHGLANARTDSDARAWIDLFGSRPRPPEALETHEIQALVFGPMGALKSAELIALSFPEDPTRCRAWLRDIMGMELGEEVASERKLSADYEPGFKPSPRIAFGEVWDDARIRKQAMIVAFSAIELKRLGLDKMGSVENDNDALNSFPPAFVDGMNTITRSRILGDEGESAPKKWEWGSPENMPDAVVLLYASTPDVLLKLTNREINSATTHGLVPFYSIRMLDLLDPAKSTEPFGFRDGISQPIIRGSNCFNLGANPIHVVEPGEFVLGYPDNTGHFPPTPVISSDYDGDCCLPSTPEN